MTAYALHTPTDPKPGRSGGGLWRKQILRKGTINYDGRPIRFDHDYIASLVAAFEQRALDQVPLQFANDANAHTEDPERTRGEIVALEETDDGLDAVIRLSERGEQTIAENPGLSVSARIVEDLRRVDGRRWPRALAHVLATINPRMTGMRPWEQVALSQPELPVVDLSAATYHKEGRMAELSDEQVAALLALLDKPEPAAPAEGDTLTDEEWQAILDAAAEPEGEPATEPTAEPALAGASLSAAQQAALDLANAQAAQAMQAAEALRAENARANWATERQLLLAEGVPPALLDLAGQVICPPVDLANGTPVAPAQVVRQMLEAAKGTIDFSVVGSSAEADPESEARQLARQFKNQFGG